MPRRRRLRLGAALVSAGIALAGGLLLTGATPPPPEADPTVGWAPLAAGEQQVTGSEFASVLTGSNWSGDWNSLVFRFDGSRFAAAYDFDSGVIVGEVVGGYANAWWCEASTRLPPSDAGQVQFRLLREADGSYRIDGRWAYGVLVPPGEWGQNWDLTPSEVPASQEAIDRLATAWADCVPQIPLGGTALGIDQPSTLSSLKTVQQVTPAAVGVASGAAVVLVAIASYPSILLGKTIEENYERLFGWSRGLRSRAGRVAEAVKRRVPAWVGVVVGLALAVVISGFVDPRFGVNAGSVRLALSLAISLVVEQLLFLLIARAILRTRWPGVVPTIWFPPGLLLIVVIAVALTRLTGIEPGIVFGLVLDLAFLPALTRARDGWFALATSAWALAVGLLGWLGYSALSALLGPSPGAVGVFAIETMSGFAVSGIAALPIALLPLATLDGGKIWAWRRWVWVAAFLVSVVAFLVIVLPFPASWGEVTQGFVGWIVVYLLYCAFAVGMWALFRFALRPKPEVEPESPAATG